MKKNNLKGLLFLTAAVFTMILPSESVLAATTVTQPATINVQDIKEDDSLLSRKESVIKFMNEHPEYKNDVLEILKNKDALNSDGSIKEDFGISENTSIKSLSATTPSVSPLFTGYNYTLQGYGPAAINYPKEYVGAFTNYSNKPQVFSVNQKFSATTTMSTSATIGSKAGLEEVYEVNANVTLDYVLTLDASREYASTLTIPGRTTGTLYASPLKTCYAYFEQYYVLGVAVGDHNTIGIFKPVAAHWYYTETKN